MLKKLYISNYAIIDELEVSFSDKLTVITGETGAGKSIVMEALSLALGERADAATLPNKEKKCIVEATWHVSELHLQWFFDDHELDFEEELILRREISSGGKSRAFINDTPVNLSALKELARLLVDMHTQHDSHQLGNHAFQITLLDSLAGQETVVKEYKKKFRLYKSGEKKRIELQEKHRRNTQELDYLRYQLNELAGAALKATEQEILELQLMQLENAGEIKEQLIGSAALLRDAEISVLGMIRDCLNRINQVKKFYVPATAILGRLESCRIELEDLAHEMENQSDQVLPDPAKLDEIQARLQLIYRLEKKHGLKSIEELIVLEKQLEEKIQGIETDTEELETLTLALEEQKVILFNEARGLSAARQQQIPLLEKSVSDMLKDTGMQHAQIRITHHESPADEISESGIDHFQLMFAPNKGSSFQDVRSIASGGELSRLMLCIKSLIASSTALPTLVFDEIDSGISGSTAAKVSQILKNLSVHHQVICITHLPQIAAKGDVHYFVYKETSGRTTFARLKSLNTNEKIHAIARMISGEKVTAASLESAKELFN